jgi:hypothetical protein
MRTIRSNSIATSMEHPDGRPVQMMCVIIKPIITITGTPSNQRRTGMSVSYR